MATDCPLLDAKVDVPQGNDTPLIELAADMLEADQRSGRHFDCNPLAAGLRTKAITALMSP